MQTGWDSPLGGASPADVFVQEMEEVLLSQQTRLSLVSQSDLREGGLDAVNYSTQRKCLQQQHSTNWRGAVDKHSFTNTLYLDVVEQLNEQALPLALSPTGLHPRPQIL